jgi:Uma2 family endonuclease
MVSKIRRVKDTMSAFAEIPYITPEEYLAREGTAQTKSEYYDGVIVAMAGGSAEHDRVTGNIFASLHTQLAGTACEPFSSNMRVVVPACNRYYYPDLSVACGGAKFEIISGVESLQNPTVIVEVLSETTERIDRGDKLLCYQTMPSLVLYAIVAQDKPVVQVYERQPDGGWRYLTYIDLNDTVELSAINCRITLREIYARVTFPPLLQAASDGSPI